MAFTKPTVTKITADISNLTIYLRSTKKFGKTTLFRDVILEKYGDPSYGLLVGVGAECGYKMLDGLNVTQVETWDDVIELKNWLISENGKEHHIKIVAFDTGDELVRLADAKTVKLYNRENPSKQTRSIKASWGGYSAGEKYSANNLIRPTISELNKAGFGVWVIAHTKLKTIKDKGSLDEDGYMQLTSNLGADYESAFGDCLDVCLTGIIDRDTEERGTGEKKKKYVTEMVRKLYFRGTDTIDAGGRFADGSVPEYMVFDKPNMAKDFIKVVEDGIEGSKTNFSSARPTTTKKAPPVYRAETPKPVAEDEDLDTTPDTADIDDLDPDTSDVDLDMDDAETAPTIDDLRTEIQGKLRTASAEVKKKAREILITEAADPEKIKLADATVETLNKILAILD